MLGASKLEILAQDFQQGLVHRGQDLDYFTIKVQLEDVLLSLWQSERRTVLFITHDLSEAVSMSDRVIVMSSRPGRIIADVPITLGRPRSVRALQKEPRYHELYAQVWSKLEEGLSQ